MSIDKDVKEIEEYLIKKQREFDRVSEISRDLIRTAAGSITKLHNNDIKSAKAGIDRMKTAVGELAKFDPSLKYYSVQALQEYAEAAIFYSVKQGKDVPDRASLEIDAEPYILGMLDVVGELKREVLNSLHNSDEKEAERYYEMMKGIYDSTAGIRFAEAILNGFRRKQDVARIQLESAGSELLFAKKRK